LSISSSQEINNRSSKNVFSTKIIKNIGYDTTKAKLMRERKPLPLLPPLPQDKVSLRYYLALKH
jgi:hypothetical protein